MSCIRASNDDLIRILRSLGNCDAPIRRAELQELVNTKPPQMGDVKLSAALGALCENGLAYYSPEAGGPSAPQAEWALTSKGWRALGERSQGRRLRDLLAGAVREYEKLVREQNRKAVR